MQQLRDLPSSNKVVTEAMAILGELGLQKEQGELYVRMLVEQASLDRDQRRHKEALAILHSAKAALTNHEGFLYTNILAHMALCHEELHQWNEAIACQKEGIEKSRKIVSASDPSYGTLVRNLAATFLHLKQYEEAIPRLEEALAIFKHAYGAQHPRTVETAATLDAARRHAKLPARHLIDVGHEFRLCNQCGTVREHMNKCDGCNRVWYCGRDCQLLHWPTHKPLCNVCLRCDTVLTKPLQCSRCNKGKYCDAECFKAHWSEHKKECAPK
jgi:tetratricopeptide (TPR) repeat protein